MATPLSLEIISEHCHFSPFHFHRIFSGAMNETLNNYIARRRLEKAANFLVFKRDKSITEIAYDCGFSSSANFSRAIKQYFGYTPKEIRQPKNEDISRLGRIFDKYGKVFDPTDFYREKTAIKTSYDASIIVEVKELATMRLAKLKSTRGYQSDSLFQTWDDLSKWGELQNIALEKQFRLAWCYDNPAVTPLDKCRYEASIEVDNDTSIAEPFTEAYLPQGSYAFLHVKGTSEDVNHAQKYLFSEWLPYSRFEPDNLPMLEHYINDVRIDGLIETEIILKLRRLG
ncbi:AraC family transcriptional regulator [Aestuariibacter salexigens]|uniref:AraC family transcriptional regulator n=1 Tax=Aestuariibacter salexigens TaxID=226010 RepID=UPI001F0AE9EF|nr:GyrI-like domain-containing protein [Aestuariibacter salexigens]